MLRIRNTDYCFCALESDQKFLLVAFYTSILFLTLFNASRIKAEVIVIAILRWTPLVPETQGDTLTQYGYFI